MRHNEQLENTTDRVIYIAEDTQLPTTLTHDVILTYSNKQTY